MIHRKQTTPGVAPPGWRYSTILLPGIAYACLTGIALHFLAPWYTLMFPTVWILPLLYVMIFVVPIPIAFWIGWEQQHYRLGLASGFCISLSTFVVAERLGVRFNTGETPELFWQIVSGAFAVFLGFAGGWLREQSNATKRTRNP